MEFIKRALINCVCKRYFSSLVARALSTYMSDFAALLSWRPVARPLTLEIVREERADNQMLSAIMRDTHQLCDQYGDVATASLLENWIDEAEGRTWFITQTGKSS